MVQLFQMLGFLSQGNYAKCMGSSALVSNFVLLIVKNGKGVLLHESAVIYPLYVHFLFYFLKILTVLGLCWGARAQQLWCAGFFSCRRHMGSQFPNEESNLHPPPCIGRQILNHWTTKEVPSMRTFKKLSSNILSFLEWVNAYVKIHLDNTSVLCISLYTQYPSTKNEKKGHILYDCIYMTCPEQVNLLKSKIYWLVVARVW